VCLENSNSNFYGVAAARRAATFGLQILLPICCKVKTFVCTLILNDGNKVVAKARAASLDDEVEVQWSGATDRMGEIVFGKYSVGFLQWYLKSRAQHFGAEIQFSEEDGAVG